MASEMFRLPHDSRTTMMTVAAIVVAVALLGFVVLTLTHAGRAY